MDYCTLWLEGWWAHCCAIHDESYTAQMVRELADAGLFQCVADSAPTPVLAVAATAIAAVMWAGVRVFGGRFYRKA